APPHPPQATPCPYTTLFRSYCCRRSHARRERSRRRGREQRRTTAYHTSFGGDTSCTLLYAQRRENAHSRRIRRSQWVVSNDSYGLSIVRMGSARACERDP